MVKTDRANQSVIEDLVLSMVPSDDKAIGKTFMLQHVMRRNGVPKLIITRIKRDQ